MTGRALRLVLASSSPRRSELIGRLGLEPTVAAPAADEAPLPGEPAPVHTLRVARLKAYSAASRHPGEPVLAADTVVVLGERLLGKPRDRGEAAAMLVALAGKSHSVVTAVVLRWGSSEASHVEHARVTMVPLNRTVLDWYVATGEGDDKAGAYALQGKGALLVERVEGNVQAVVGLPLAPLPALLRRVGLDLAAEGDRLVVVRRQVPEDAAR